MARLAQCTSEHPVSTRFPHVYLHLSICPSQVPATDWEALKSPLMGLFEKRRAAKFFSFCQQYDERNPQVRGGVTGGEGRDRDLIGRLQWPCSS